MKLCPILTQASRIIEFNFRLEEELDSMENTNTELKNVINTLNNDRENLLEQVIEKRTGNREEDR